MIEGCWADCYYYNSTRAVSEYCANKKFSTSLSFVGYGTSEGFERYQIYLNNQGDHSELSRINLVSFRTFRDTLFHKLEIGRALYLWTQYSEVALGIWLAADFQKSRRTSHTEKVCKLSCKKIPDKITLSAQQGWCWKRNWNWNICVISLMI